MSLFPSRRLFSSLPDFPLFLPRFPHFLEKFSASSGLVPRGTATKKRARGERTRLGRITLDTIRKNFLHRQSDLLDRIFWSATKKHNFKKTTSLTFLKSTRTKKRKRGALSSVSLFAGAEIGIQIGKADALKIS